MKNLITMLLLLLISIACKQNNQIVRSEKLFDDDWKFFRGDIEGAEQAAFAGMERILQDNEQLKIFIEFYSDWIKRAGGSPKEFARVLLEAHHLSAIDMEDKKGVPITEAEELVNHLGDRVGNLFLEKG